MTRSDIRLQKVKIAYDMYENNEMSEDSYTATVVEALLLETEPEAYILLEEYLLDD